MKQYMESALPLSLIEAARIDGSGEFHTFNQIVLPLMKPAIAVQAIFTFVSSWNNYFTPALILHDDKKKTLPILIAQLSCGRLAEVRYGAGVRHDRVLHIPGYRRIPDPLQTHRAGRCPPEV